jgi:uncharacterized protein
MSCLFRLQNFAWALVAVMLLPACSVESAAPSLPSSEATDLDPLKIENHFSGNVRELAMAAASGDEQKVAELIKARGVDPNARGIEKMPVLLWPVYKNNIAGFRALLANGADPNALINNPLHTDQSTFALIISLRGMDFVEAALAHGANPNAKNEDDVPMIHIAERAGKWDVVRALIAKGADINASSNGLPGNNILAAAVGLGDFEHAFWLLEHGADPSHMISEKMAANPRVIGTQPIIEQIFHRPMATGAKGEKQKQWQKKCQELLLSRGIVAPPVPERYKPKT